MPSKANVRLDDLAFKPLIEKGRGAAGEQIRDQPLIVERQAEQALAEASVADHLKHAAACVRWRAQSQIAQDAAAARSSAAS